MISKAGEIHSQWFMLPRRDQQGRLSDFVFYCDDRVVDHHLNVFEQGMCDMFCA